MNTYQKHQQILTVICELLSDHPETMYNQKEIVEKLEVLEVKVSTGHFSKAVNGIKIGSKSMADIAKGMQQIIALELNMRYDLASNSVEKNVDADWTRTKIGKKEPIFVISEPTTNGEVTIHNPTYRIQKGRMTVTEKVDFMSSAQKEIILVGVRLRQFSAYFTTRSDAEFKNRIEAILERGVNINCYLLDPESHVTRMYLEDRAEVIPKERGGEGVIREVIEELKKISTGFVKQGYKGRMNLYTYRHVPHNYFMAVDGDTPQGKIAGSHYLYGKLRSKSPVFAIEKQQEKELFTLYWESLKAVCQDAKVIEIS